MSLLLSFISGKRGATVGAEKSKRILWAQQVLRKEFLPHIGIDEHCETSKVFFFGYMIHKLLLTHLGRRQIDDRYAMESEVSPGRTGNT